MKNIIRIFLLATPFFIPHFTGSSNVGDFLTAVSLLFAILAGFFIAAATSNYLRHQTLIASENAAIISIAGLAKKIDPANSDKVVETIDVYMIAILDYDLLDYPQKTKREFDMFIDAIDSITPSNNPQASIYQNLHDQKANLLAINQESYLTAKKIVGPLHWFVISLLACLVAALLLILRDGTLVSSLVTGVLILGVFEILELIRIIDSNQFLATKIAFESPQEVFRSIGRLNYYPSFAVKNKTRDLPPRYRLGVYKDYPHSLNKEIKIIQSEESNSFENND